MTPRCHIPKAVTMLKLRGRFHFSNCDQMVNTAQQESHLLFTGGILVITGQPLPASRFSRFGMGEVRG